MEQRKKRIGPTHRLRKCDPPPWPNDWLEAVIVASLFFAVSALVAGMYFLARTI